MDPYDPRLVPPDVPNLPTLPDRFSWQLPHIKQHRRETPAVRQIVVDGQGPAVASVQPGLSKSSTLLGIHRALHSQRHYREFAGPDSRVIALRYIARWVEKYAAQIIEEVEARPYR
ncbi:hypothetical protein [Lysobacter sp. CA199]|uniref:hypothetical protein n=1 Tax=Lysobacter sp. CA199 TaxID=3455608 RepID=UPI003F8D3F84